MEHVGYLIAMTSRESGGQMPHACVSLTEAKYLIDWNERTKSVSALVDVSSGDPEILVAYYLQDIKTDLLYNTEVHTFDSAYDAAFAISDFFNRTEP